MRTYQKWVLTLGILSVTPGITMAGLPQLFKFKTSKTATKQQAIGTNQKGAERIAKALRGANLKGYDIKIEFKGGIATLNGKVADSQQRANAERIVKKVRGVHKVNNRLALIPRSNVAKPQLARSTSAAKTSPIVPARIQDEQPTVSPFIPRVKKTVLPSPQSRVNDARPVVAQADFDLPTLAGQRQAATIQQLAGSTVPVPPEAQAASQKAPQIPAKQHNQQMAERIAAALRRAKLTGYDIEIVYQQGTAKLTGAVATPQERAMVTQVVYRVPDIGFVDNRLSLMNQSPQSPSRASQAMRPAMPRLGLPIPQMPFRSNGQVPNGYPMANPAVYPVAYQNGQPQVPAGPPMPPQSSIPAPPAYGHPGSGQSHVAYDMPHLPEYAWPAYASYPNYAQVTYPKEYAASAWPYIGPFYPYPQIPLGWRQVQLEWDDGHWNLNFRPRTDKWWWFLDPENW